MRILRAKAENFQSYQQLDFSFANLGLTLLSGDTGVGKSTILDVPAWILFGTTSKDTNADDVRTWNSTEPTVGILEIEKDGILYEITRIRGTSHQNDLFFTENGSEIIRGKDLKETQKKLENTLNVNAELFFTASYFHQFSSIDSFFTSKAKDRRSLMEKIADVGMPVLLSEKLSDKRKSSKNELKELLQDIAFTNGKLEQLLESQASTQKLYDKWSSDNEVKITQLKHKAEDFEKYKADKVNALIEKLEKLDKSIVSEESFIERIEQSKQQIRQFKQVREDRDRIEKEYNILNHSLSEKLKEKKRFMTSKEEFCPHCLGPSNNTNKDKHLTELNSEIQELMDVTHGIRLQLVKLEETVKAEEKAVDNHEKIMKAHFVNNKLVSEFQVKRMELEASQYEKNIYEPQYREALEAKNPHESTLKKLSEELTVLDIKKHTDDVFKKDLEHEIASLTYLYDKSFELRAILLSNAIRELEIRTNQYLDDHFEGELKIRLLLESSDKLEIEITKNGNICSFKQLSGGQRRILKLAFGLSVMKLASDKSGVSFNIFSFDEVLNGLDDRLKVKAFSLFQTLEKEVESVILIDHCSEFKSMFDNQFTVTMHGDISEVIHEERTEA